MEENQTVPAMISEGDFAAFLEGEKVEALDNIPVWSVLPSTAALNEESLKGLLMGTMSGEDLLAQSIGSIPFALNFSIIVLILSINLGNGVFG